MADDAVFSSPKKGGIPPWLMIGGAGVGILAVIYLVTKGSSSGGSTTAAGASINADLGSLEEEQQNLLGTVQAGQLANTSNFQSVGGQIADTQSAILAAIGAQGTITGQQVQGAIDNINQNTNAGNQSVLGSIASALQQVLTGQGAITSTVQSESQNIQSEVGGVASNIAQTQNTIIGQLGTIQSSEQGLISTIEPEISTLLGQTNQIADLQQQLATSTGSEAASIQQQITSLQSAVQTGQASILQTIGQAQGQNQTNFNAVQAALNTNFGGLSGMLLGNSTGF